MRAHQFIKEDWQKVNKSDKTDGMSKKAVKAYRRENPGSKLKTAVTKKPSELKAGSKDAKRRKSFCARMSGNKGPMKDEKGRPTPKAKALARWNCESMEQIEKMLDEVKKDPCWDNYKQVGTKKKNGKTVPNCVPVNEEDLGVRPKRTLRQGSRPARGHATEPRYKTDPGISKDQETEFHTKLDALVHDTFGKRDIEIEEHKKNRVAKKYTTKPVAPIKPSEVHAKAKAKVNAPVEQKVDEKASRALCTSSKPDEDLGASNLASCKSQGLRARDGNKSHKLGKSPKSRVKVGGHKIKGHKYGGPLPDWS